MRFPLNHEDTTPESTLVFQLGEEFLAAKRRGEEPQIAVYCQRHPEVADELKELLQTMQMMESLPEDTAAVTDPLSEMKGQELGDYRLGRVIGRGGMGVVYEAQQLSLQRRVAVKLLRQYGDTAPQNRIRFLREAKAVAQLHHTNIIPIYEIGQQGETSYFAMQLVDGISLDRLIAFCSDDSNSRIWKPASTADERQDETQIQPDLRRDTVTAKLPVLFEPGEAPKQRDVVNMTIQAARALQHAHQRGIVHRDVKPSNLILDQQGVVWLTDFGLAKTEQDDLTATGDILGTLRYMSPERFRGQCDAFSDIYALGLTLHELLVLRPAFEADERMNLIQAIMHGKPTPLRSIDSSIPRDLETIVSKATASLPHERFRSAKELADDLERFLNDEPIHSRPPSTLEKLVRWSRRNRLVAALLVLLFSVLSLTSIVMSQAYSTQRRLTQQKTEETERANQATLEASESLRLAEQRGDQLRRQLYSSEMQQASGMVRDPLGAEQVRNRLSAWLPTAKTGDPDLRGWEWYFLDAATHQFSQRFVTDAPSVIGAEWVGDSKLISAQADVDVRVWDIAARPPAFKSLYLGAYANATASRPENSQVAILLRRDKDNLILVDEEKIIWKTTQPLKEAFHLYWHPREPFLAGFFGRSWMAWSSVDGTRLLAGELERDIENLVWDFDGNMVVSMVGGSQTWDLSRRQRLATEADEEHWIAFDPEGRCRVSKRPGRATIEYRRSDGSWSQSTISNTTRSMLSPDAMWLATTDNEGTVKLWNTQTGSRVRNWIGQAGRINSIRWDRSSRRILTASDDGSACIWDIERSPSLTSVLNREAVARFAPGGKRLLRSLNRRISIVDANGDPLLEIGPMAFQVTSIAWHPGGDRFAIGGADGRFEVWAATESSSRRILQAQLPTEFELNRIDYLADGETLVACSGDYGVHVIEASTGKIKWTFDEHGSGVFDLKCHPNADWVATAGANGSALIWDSRDGRIRHELRGHNGFVTAVAWSPGGDQLLTGGAQGEMILWDAEAGNMIWRLDGHTRRITGIEWAPDGSRIASVGEDDQLRIWDPRKGLELFQFELESTNEAYRVDWSSSGNQIVASGARGYLVLDASQRETAEGASRTKTTPRE